MGNQKVTKNLNFFLNGDDFGLIFCKNYSKQESIFIEINQSQ